MPGLEYGDELEVRRVSQQGSVKWNGERTFISEVFGHEDLGLKPVGEDWLEVYYGPIRIGWLNGRKQQFSRKMPKLLKPEERDG